MQHLNVVRAIINQPIVLFNGDGNNYQGHLYSLTKRQAEVSIEQCESCENESPVNIHLGLVLSKGDRYDWALQKATELGVVQITPLTSEYCNVKLDAKRLEKRMQHWQQVLISACEQSERAVIPKLNSALDFNHFVANLYGSSVILSPIASQSIEQLSPPIDNQLTLLVGPEGGFSNQELNLAHKHKIEAVKMGTRILRTETAPLAFIAVAQYLWGDF